MHQEKNVIVFVSYNILSYAWSVFLGIYCSEFIKTNMICCRLVNMLLIKVVRTLLNAVKLHFRFQVIAFR